ncbi:MAG: response regulator [Bacteriovoracaceae bacterium]|nr:response regulator [Bacteriovoracaceae bacterium]
MKKTLLIVDDELAIRKLLEAVFEGLVDHMYVAENGNIAKEMLKEHKEINCVISDISMPECDGFMLLEDSKAKYPEIPFIILSAYGDSNNMKKANSLGAFGFVNKTEWDQVVKVVESAYNIVDD